MLTLKKNVYWRSDKKIFSTMPAFEKFPENAITSSPLLLGNSLYFDGLRSRCFLSSSRLSLCLQRLAMFFLRVIAKCFVSGKFLVALLAAEPLLEVGLDMPFVTGLWVEGGVAVLTNERLRFKMDFVDVSFHVYSTLELFATAISARKRHRQIYFLDRFIYFWDRAQMSRKRQETERNQSSTKK